MGWASVLPFVLFTSDRSLPGAFYRYLPVCIGDTACHPFFREKISWPPALWPPAVSHSTKEDECMSFCWGQRVAWDRWLLLWPFYISEMGVGGAAVCTKDLEVASAVQSSEGVGGGGWGGGACIHPTVADVLMISVFPSWKFGPCDCRSLGLAV